MKKILNYFLILIFSLSLVSCASSSQNIEIKEKDSISYSSEYTLYDGFTNVKYYESMINYEELSNQAINVIFKNNKIPKRLIVTDFVDLNSLENSTPMGYILSNSIKNSLINLKRIKIIEAELSKNFKISQNGLRVLSRNIKDIKSKNYNVEKAIAGTYTYNEVELIVFVKLINLKDGTIEGSYTKSLPIGRSIKNMLDK